MTKEMHPVDRFFRDALQDHTVQPSETAKAAFLKEAASIVPEKRPAGKKPYIFLLLGLLILITGATLYFTSTGDRKSPPPKAAPAKTEYRPVPAASQPSPAGEGHAAPKTGPTTGAVASGPSSPAAASPVQRPLTTPAIATRSNRSKSNKSPIEKNTTRTVQTGNPDGTKTIAEQTEPASRNEITRPQITAEPEPESPTPIPPLSASNPTEPKNAETKPETPTNPVAPPAINPANPDDQPGKKTKRASPARTREFAINAGVSYSPEWMFNTLDGDKYVNNFGLEGTFRYDRFSIRTGAGMSITRGTHEVIIGYNDYLGNYQQLDSIAFNWDENHYTLVPTYFTSDKEVYDSLLKEESSRLEKRYTYLQIPLILGYDFYRHGILSLGVRTGPVISILLSSKQLSGEFDPGKNRVVSVNDITPDRVQTNWQFMAGLNASLAISRRFSLELEPSARYYFNSVYEKSAIDKKPWSVGIRAAFLINF